MHDIGPPKITFVGSSHVHHLMEVSNSRALPAHTRRFLSESRFVGCGGLKFWTARDELNGVFTSEYKLNKYGNLWQSYDALDFKPDWFVTMLGGNDCDDYWGYLLKFLADDGPEMYNLHLENDIYIWMDAIAPHIVDFFTVLQNKCDTARLAYIPALPRRWWCDSTQELSRRIDEFISFNLRVDYNIKVKLIYPHSLLRFGIASPEASRHENETVRGFLKHDWVHLNHRGYQAIINEVAIPLMDQRALVKEYRSRDFPGKARKSQLRKCRFRIP